MKRRNLSFIPLAILMAIFLVGCGADSVPDEETTTTTEENESDGFDVSWMSSEELDQFIESQDNRNNMNAYVYDGNWIYGPCDGGLAKTRTDHSEWTMVDWVKGESTLPGCHGIVNGYLYYDRQTEKGDGRELVKMRLSGKDAEVIVPDIGVYAQITEEGIYYTSPETYIDERTVTEDSSHLFHCGLDGKDVECILDKPTYYFTVLGEWVLYQDDRDNCSLHLYNMESQEDKKLNDNQSFWPVYDGEYIYYLSGGDGESYTLWRVSIDGTVNEEITKESNMACLTVKGEYVYFNNEKDEYRLYRCRKDGSGLELITQDKNVGGYQWVGGNLVYIAVNDSNYVENFFLCSADGSNKVEFSDSDVPWFLF